MAWLYSIGTILSLFLDSEFKEVRHRSRFTRRIRWLRDPFYIVCGFGNTGSMIVKGLLKRAISAVILERKQEIIHAMALDDDFSHLPALAGDVTDRRLLELAGLENKRCLGVMAITNEDHANLTIAITSKLLRPELPVFARSETRRVSANMASFGIEHRIDPYTIFAERFYLALSSPTKYLVQDWLIGIPGSELRTEIKPPPGRWIIAGLGRFGSRIASQLNQAGLPFTIIDVHPDRVEKREDAVLGRGTEAHTLMEAGVKEAVGIIAGHANAFLAAANEGEDIRLEHITYNLRMENPVSLDCVCLLLERGASRLFLPGPKQELLDGDHLLFAGRGTAHREMIWNLTEPSVLIEFATARPQARGAVMRWLARHGTG